MAVVATAGLMVSLNQSLLIPVPSRAGYRILFGLCSGAAVLAAGIALLVPYPPGYSRPTAAPAQVMAGPGPDDHGGLGSAGRPGAGPRPPGRSTQPAG